MVQASLAARLACTIVPNGVMLGSAPDDEGVIGSKHVEQENTVE